MRRKPIRTVLTSLLAALVGTLVAVTPVAVAPPAQAAIFVGNTPAVAWGVDGPVFAVRMVGDTVLVGGRFQNAVAPDGTTVPRRNLAAFSFSTGALRTDWRADTNGVVRAIAVAGESVWVGGAFTAVGGRTHRNLAKVSLATGAVDSAFTAGFSNAAGGSTVRALIVDEFYLFAGGTFSRVNGRTDHPRLVKLGRARGAIVNAFQARPDSAIWSMARTRPGAPLYIGGPIRKVNGVNRNGLAAVSSATGRLVGPFFGGFTGPGTLSLAVSPDGSSVYGASTANRCVAWRTSNGTFRWSVRTGGNAQAVRVHRGVTYCGFHDHFLLDETRKAVAINSFTGVVDDDWRPSINSFYGVRAITVSDAGLVLAGSFTRVSGVRARRVAIFRP